MCGEAGAPAGRRWSLGPGAPKPLPVLLVTRPGPAARRSGGGARPGRRGRDGVPVSMWFSRRRRRHLLPGGSGGGGGSSGIIARARGEEEGSSREVFAASLPRQIPPGRAAGRAGEPPAPPTRAAAPSLPARPPPKVLCRLFPREGEIYALHYCSSPPPSKQDGLSLLSLSLSLTHSLSFSPRLPVSCQPSRSTFCN